MEDKNKFSDGTTKSYICQLNDTVGNFFVTCKEIETDSCSLQLLVTGLLTLGYSYYLLFTGQVVGQTRGQIKLDFVINFFIIHIIVLISFVMVRTIQKWIGKLYRKDKFKYGEKKKK